MQAMYQDIQRVQQSYATGPVMHHGGHYDHKAHKKHKGGKKKKGGKYKLKLF